jgi:hypothetical protein
MVSQVIQNLAQQAEVAQQAKGNARPRTAAQTGQASNKRPLQARRINRQQVNPSRLSVQRAQVPTRPVQARAVQAPAQVNAVQRQAGVQQNIGTQTRDRHLRHIHSELEDEIDLSDVDERHLGHIRSRINAPRSQQREAARHGRAARSLTDQNIEEHLLGEEQDGVSIEEIGAELTAVQRAFVVGELLVKTPAFQDPLNF